MRIYLLLISWLVSAFLWGQSHVIVSPQGLTALSPGSVAAADVALANASANSDFDVRMAFMTSAGGVGDRFQEYETFLDPDRYMEFLATPYDDALNDDNEDVDLEHQRLLARGVDTLGGGGARSVLIVYTNVLSISDAGTSYSQKKTILYGNGLTGCDLRRFKQIDDFANPPPDYCVASAPETNDAYLAWISGHLADAMGEDVVITGSILFQGKVYCELEDVYISDQQEEVVTVQSSNTHWIEVLINDNIPSPSISWTAPGAMSYMYEQADLAKTQLLINPFDYGQFTTLEVQVNSRYGSKIRVFPVNFRVGINRRVVEQLPPVPAFELSYFNNDQPFTVRGDIGINLTGTFTGAPNINVDAGESTLEWVPGEDVCGDITLSSRLINVPVLNGIRKDEEVKVRCPFPLEGIEASVLYAKDIGNSAPDPLRIRKAEVGESLYIVRAPDNDDDDGDREIRYDLKWEDDIEPEPDDFWDYGTTTLLDDDPKWNFGSHSSTIDKHMHKTEGGYAETEYNDHFPFVMATSIGGVAPNLIDYLNGGIIDQLEYPLSAEAFGVTKNKSVYFLAQDKRKYDPLSPLLKNSLKKINTFIQKAAGALQILKIKVEPFIGVMGIMEHYNEEDPASAGYYRYEKNTLSGQFGLQTKGFQQLDENGVPTQDQSGAAEYSQVLPPPFGFDASPVAKGGLFVKGKVFVKPSFTKKSRILNTTREHEIVEWSYKYGLGAQLDAGGTVEVLPDYKKINADLKVYLTVPVGGEVEVSYHPQEPEENQFQFDGEIYFGAITAKILGGISYTLLGAPIELLTINQNLGTLLERQYWPDDDE